MSSQHSRHSNVSYCATAVSFNSATFKDNIYHKNMQTLKWFSSTRMRRLNNPISRHLEYMCSLYISRPNGCCLPNRKKNIPLVIKQTHKFPNCPWVLRTNSPVGQPELAAKTALIKVYFHYIKLQSGFLVYESCQPWQNNLTTWVKYVQLNK